MRLCPASAPRGAASSECQRAAGEPKAKDLRPIYVAMQWRRYSDPALSEMQRQQAGELRSGFGRAFAHRAPQFGVARLLYARRAAHLCATHSCMENQTITFAQFCVDDNCI